MSRWSVASVVLLTGYADPVKVGLVLLHILMLPPELVHRLMRCVHTRLCRLSSRKRGDMKDASCPWYINPADQAYTQEFN